MARKRARTKDGHFVADDPTTPENEAWVDAEAAVSGEETSDEKAAKREKASKKAKAKKAPAPAPAFTMFVSANPEASVYDIRVGDIKVRGIWDGAREHVSWRVPASLTEAMMKHHMVWSGRIINAEED